MRRVIALDPGGTTGWAMYTEYTSEAIVKFDYGQIGPYEHHVQLWQLLEGSAGYETEIVCESFEYRNTARPGLVLVSKEYIGITKLACLKMNMKFTEQTASKAKGFVRDAHLKRLGLWSSNYVHAMDAMRHMIFYLVNGDRKKDRELRERILKIGYTSPPVA